MFPFLKKKEEKFIIDTTKYDEVKAKRELYKNILDKLLIQMQEVKDKLEKSEEYTLERSKLLKSKKELDHRIKRTNNNLSKIKTKFLEEKYNVVRRYLYQKHNISISKIIKELDL